MSKLKRHVIFISLDTVRADVAYSGKYPSLNRLTADGTRFETTVSSSPLTPVSHATILTGVQPPAHGVRHLFRERLSPRVETLAEGFRDQGYATCGIVSCPGLNRWYGHCRGFDHWDDEIPRLADGRDALHVNDVKIRGSAAKRAPLVVQRALDWMRAHCEHPVFLFAHFFDAHWPYEAPEDFLHFAANPYEREVAFMDHHLGRLLDGLAALGVDGANSLFVVFADHGEDLAGWYPDDHAGALGHPEEQGHGCCLFDVTQLVPLWIVGEGIAAPGTVVSEQVRLVDIVPTVREILKFPPGYCEGESLCRLMEGVREADRPAYFETFYPEELAVCDRAFSHLAALAGIRTNRNEKTIWSVGASKAERYDLAADPAERNPMQCDVPEILRKAVELPVLSPFVR